jgi:hypothetical protein
MQPSKGFLIQLYLVLPVGLENEIDEIGASFQEQTIQGLYNFLQDVIIFLKQNFKSVKKFEYNFSDIVNLENLEKLFDYVTEMEKEDIGGEIMTEIDYFSLSLIIATSDISSSRDKNDKSVGIFDEILKVKAEDVYGVEMILKPLENFEDEKKHHRERGPGRPE